MIYENVELHNVAEIQCVKGGVRLQRIPESVRKHVNENAQIQILKPDNCEIRFVSNSQETCVTLSSEGETDVTVFYGTFDGRERYVIGRQPVTIRLCLPEGLRKMDRRESSDQPFSPCVCRLLFGGRRRDPVVLHRIDGDDVRPPQPAELPRLRYLAYGTSITNGIYGAGPHLSYVAQTAWHLAADLINLGVAGSCHCEAAFADHIAGRMDWDIASLALSVNMEKFPMNEFRKRVEYMVHTVAGSDTRRPVACITLYPYSRDFGLTDPNAQYGGTPEEYRQTLREVVKECPYPNIHLIEGPELLTNRGGLSSDLLHPSDNGMIEIGHNLSRWLRPLLEGVARAKVFSKED